MATEQTFIIVGASLAGAMAVQTLRQEGVTGRLVLIGDEAGMHVNQWDQGIAPVAHLIRGGEPVDRHRLADATVPLADTIKS